MQSTTRCDGRGPLGPKAVVCLQSLLIALCLLAPPCRAARAGGPGPLDKQALPEALKPWIPWALHGKRERTCPMLFGEADGARCRWPARLALRLDERGGQLTLELHQHVAGWAELPGDTKRWPQDVVRAGPGRARLAVVARAGVPSVWLAAGTHSIGGRFLWDALPESLRVPPDTGLLALTVGGKPIARPNRQPDGRVYLQPKRAAASEGERLKIVVHRKVDDETPLLLTTRLVLNIAGKKREVLLGRSLPDGFTPLSLESELPARVEADSRIRIQVRPGTWTVTLVARSLGPVAALSRPKPGGPWRAGEEVWVFAAQSALRQVTVEGVGAIDPQQTSLPAAWKRLPAYPMKVGDTMRLTQKRRGDAAPTPDRLTLQRTLWLDFDGRGLTASDRISGALRRATRLEMAAPGRLGRVAIGNRDQFITHLGNKGRRGVELRPGALSLEADSRVEGDARRLPAVGWDRDFHQVSARLHLPPGWRLLHASGVDEVRGTWLRHWTLLEIFLALVLSLAIGRLLGWRWGLLALASLVLLFPERNAPKWIWTAVLAFEALCRAVPEGKLQRVLEIGRHAVCVLLVLLSIPFVVGHVRTGIYPGLERPGFGGGGFLFRAGPDASKLAASEDKPQAVRPKGVIGGRERKVPVDTDTPDWKVTPQQQQVQQVIVDGKLSKKRISSSISSGLYGIRGPRSGKRKARAQAYQLNVETYDPQAMVQTGPGRPSWSWRNFSLSWSGPVQRGQQLRLYLSSPLVNLLLALARAALLILLVLRLVPWRLRLPRTASGAGTATAAAILLGLGVGGFTATARAEQPDDHRLSQLAEVLLARPDCAPSCAAIPKMILEAEPTTLRLRLEVVAARADSGVPLPGHASQWLASRVLLDGKPARGLARDTSGKLWLLVGPGSHQVLLEGPLPDRESVQLALPLRPHRVEAKLRGWSLDGLHEDGLVDDSLQLTRTRGSGGAEASLEPAALPPFVHVERRLLIGLNWQVQTRVIRRSPLGQAAVIEVPLLAGESVTTADVRVAKGKVSVNLGPQETEKSWRSVLAERSPLALVAPKVTSWTEVWLLELSPIWHAELSGIPTLHPGDGGAVPEWRPWPGEKLEIAISRPAGVAGKTTTIDRSRLQVAPGVRATESTLQLVLRSSRGAQHTLTLPDGAALDSVKVDGRLRPVRQIGRKVTLDLVPGSQRVELRWRVPGGDRFYYRVTPADLGAPSVNAETTLRVSNSRWVLLIGGPRLGPAVLFWSLLLVLLIVAVALGQIRWSPLRWWQWMLLAIGLSQVHIALAAVVVGWLLLLARRARHASEPPSDKRLWFNARQILIPIWTLVSLGVLVFAVREGLLGEPRMQIEGNGSYGTMLRWFEDRPATTPEGPWMLSAPLTVYRLVMLAWALWLAFAVLGWLRWGWGAFGDGGFWKKGPPPARPVPSAPTSPPAPAPAPAALDQPAEPPTASAEPTPAAEPDDEQR